MTAEIFNKVLRDIDMKMINLKKKILLLMDNTPSHKPIALKNVEILMLPANMTSCLQPLDADIIASFKKHYR